MYFLSDLVLFFGLPSEPTDIFFGFQNYVLTSIIGVDKGLIGLRWSLNKSDGTRMRSKK